jgi:hypothetical protein
MRKQPATTAWRLNHRISAPGQKQKTMRARRHVLANLALKNFVHPR